MENRAQWLWTSIVMAGLLIAAAVASRARATVQVEMVRVVDTHGSSQSSLAR